MNHWLYVAGNHSYGYAGRKVAEALYTTRISESWHIEDLWPRFEEGKDGGWTGPDWEGAGTAILFSVPEYLEHVHADRVVIFTMFEGKGLPGSRVRLVNEYADLCVVPSRWCKEGFEECGVSVPVAVAPLGVDGADYPLRGSRVDFPLRARPSTGSGCAPGVYRFLWNGGNDTRKGWDLVYREFWEVFRGSEEVELVLHFRNGTPGENEFGDRNVRVVTGHLPHEEYVSLLHEVDCYVFPSRSEGWGLPPREAAATGLPVIATDYSGMAEDIGHWGLPVRNCKEVPVHWNGFEDEGRLPWGVPCHHDLGTLMRWCFEHQELAAERGFEAARWLRAHGGWEVTVREMEMALLRQAQDAPLGGEVGC